LFVVGCLLVGCWLFIIEIDSVGAKHSGKESIGKNKQFITRMLRPDIRANNLSEKTNNLLPECFALTFGQRIYRKKQTMYYPNASP
jgi:hypothetical protein